MRPHDEEPPIRTQDGIGSSGFGGSSPSQDFRRSQADGYRGGSHNRQGRRHHRNSGRHGMSPYATPSSHSGPPGRMLACSVCRRRKIRCDGVRPVCGRCILRDIPCEYSKEAIPRAEAQLRQYENPNAIVNDHNTTNYGEGSQTYNGSRVYNNRRFDRRSNSSAVVHVHVRGSGSTSSSSRSPTSSSGVTPPSSRETALSSTTSDSAPKGGRELTRSESYTSLLLECGLGHPLWKPIPRCTPEGEYIVSIGDVGIISDGLPFNILFNITQPIDSLANKDGIPEGVHPPCTLQPRWLTVIDKFHQERTTFIRPKGSISIQDVQEMNPNSIYTYTLTDTHGALLMLPKGGTLKNLERTTEFHGRIQMHWRQWYEFAERQGDLGGNQTLYVVTGVEQCSTWAIATWDHAPGDPSEPLTLKLAVDESFGTCSWGYSTGRCETQSLTTISGPTEGGGDLKQTVFVRGFWINKVGGPMSGSFSPSTRLGGLGGGLDGDDNFGGSGGFHGRCSSGPSSISNATSLPGLGSSPASNSVPRVQNLSADCLGLSDRTVHRPCEVINRFAFEVISRMNPAVVNAESIVVSHDNDWISILEESDDGFPSKIEIIKRICSKFKFVVENDTIYTAELMDDDVALVQRNLITVDTTSSVMIPVMVEFREADLWQEARELLTMATDVHHGSERDSHHKEHPPQTPEPAQKSSLVHTRPCTTCRRRKIKCNREVVPETNMCLPCHRSGDNGCDLLTNKKTPAPPPPLSSTAPSHRFCSSRSPSPSMSIY